MRFEYPIKISGDTEEALEEKVAGMMGSRNQLGFFPIGRLNNWHGGIHIEGYEELYAIADGRVIAYRVPKKYKIETIEGNDFEYSNGFVLIQHDYKSPKGLDLIFYSLYHHLCSYEEMEKEGRTLPDFIEKSGYKVKGKVPDPKAAKGADDIVIKGENVRSAPPLKKLIGFIPNDSEVTLEGALVSDYYKFTSSAITGFSEDTYIYKSSIKSIVSSADLDVVKNCDKKIKAGALVGHTGMFGFEKKKSYRASHVEVFSADNVDAFLSGKSEDIAESKNYIKIKEGTGLQKASPYTIQNGWNIKVLESGDSYTKVQQHALEAIVNYDDLDDKNKKENDKYVYKPNTGEAFDRLNKAFNSLLKPDSTLVLEAKADETTNGITIKKRKVRFLPVEANQYWVMNSNLPAGGEVRALNSDLSELFLEKPSGTEKTEKVNAEVIVRVNSTKKVKDAQNVEWYFIKCSYLKDGRREHKSGWIKVEEVTKVSAYNWKEFGFSVLEDLSDNYVYDIEETPPFLKAILQEIDTAANEDDAYNEDKKGILTAFELRSALSKTHVAKKLSHLVCRHTSEWAYESSTVKSEVEKFLNKGVNLEQDAKKKEELNKKKKVILDSIDLRVPELNIWSKVSKGPVSPAVNTAPAKTRIMVGGDVESPPPQPPPRKFPSEKVVYHFHPIAFVEQMKRMETCYCNRDITEEEMIEIVTAMRKSEPAVYKVNKEKLFTSKNCNLPDSEKNYNRFTEEFNKATRYYEINTCIRKIHFLAQTYWESDRLRTTKEYGEGIDYSSETHKDNHDKYILYLNFLNKYGGAAGQIEDKVKKIDSEYESCKEHYDIYEANKNKNGFNLRPYKDKHEKYSPYLRDKELYNSYKVYSRNYNRYKECQLNQNTETGDGPRYAGKGLMQLTWRITYMSYFTYLLNFRKEILEKNTKAGISLEEISERANGYHDKLSNNLFFSIDSGGWFWAVFKKFQGNNLNHWADYGERYVQRISTLVNGGSLGKQERIQYFKEISENVFKIKSRCENYLNIKKDEN